jgi:hypothetical protein
MSLIEFAQLLYDSELGTALRESIYAFPIVEGLHLIGLAFSFGLLMFIDLRLLGVFLESEPAQDLLRSLRPWLLVGFAVTLITGILLFIATATKVIYYLFSTSNSALSSSRASMPPYLNLNGGAMRMTGDRNRYCQTVLNTQV